MKLTIDGKSAEEYFISLPYKIIADYCNKLKEGQLLSNESLAKALNINVAVLRNHGKNQIFANISIRYGGKRVWGNKKTINYLKQQFNERA